MPNSKEYGDDGLTEEERIEEGREYMRKIYACVRRYFEGSTRV